MPMFFISLIIAILVFVLFICIFKKKEKEKGESKIFSPFEKAVLVSIILIVLLFFASNIGIRLFPKNYALIDELKIKKITIEGIKGEKYIITGPEFFAEDKNGKIQRYSFVDEEKLNITEEKRNDGIVKIYEPKSKAFKFFSIFKGRKYKTFIPIGGVLDY